MERAPEWGTTPTTRVHGVSKGADIEPKPAGVYRLAVWTVGAAIDKRFPLVESLDADVVVTARSGNEVRLLKANRTTHSAMAWVGRHAQRGLGVISFDPTFVKLEGGIWDQRLEWIAPVSVNGPVMHKLLAVWALNEQAQVKFKTDPPASQPIQMMRLYRKLLDKPTVIAGDFNNNPVFHRNDPNWDMLELIARLEAHGFVSAYHEFSGLDHGDPREQPTRFKPEIAGIFESHHTDYCFIPVNWLPALRNVQIGSPEHWFKHVRAEEHVPVVVDFDQPLLGEILTETRRRNRQGGRS